MKRPAHFRFTAAALLVAIIPTIMAGQGPLTPPGAPAPTMKTLAEIDAHVETVAASKRKPINSANTPGDATNTYIITQPGSYYLTGNLSGTSGQGGISIQADNVTVDLNGFALIGVAGSLDGIKSSYNNLGLRNGSLRSWGGLGVNLTGSNSVLEELRSSNNGGNGLSTGGTAVIKNCAAANNGGAGIAFANGTVTGCVASSNSAVGFFAQGVATVTNCLATSNGGGGFRAFNECVFSGCLASGNTADGFYFLRYCLLSGNSAISNAGNGFKADLPVFGSLNRIDGNTAISNGGYGIQWNNDLVIRNSCYLNTLGNYNPASGGAFGPVQAASTATNPFANF